MPVTSVRTASETSAARTWLMAAPLHQMQGEQDHVDELDARERNEDAAHAVDPDMPPQDGRGADRAVAHALQGERNQRDDDESVEDDGGEDRALRRGQPRD